MLDSSRHDAETFRVAEELIMLSSRAAAASPLGESGDSPSNISGFCEHVRKEDIRLETFREEMGHRFEDKGEEDAQGEGEGTSQEKVKKRSSRGVAHKSSDRDSTKQESAQVAPDQSAQDIINSRCDVSLSELLKEHRVRFRRVRRRYEQTAVDRGTDLERRLITCCVFAAGLWLQMEHRAAYQEPGVPRSLPRAGDPARAAPRSVDTLACETAAALLWPERVEETSETCIPNVQFPDAERPAWHTTTAHSNQISNLATNSLPQQVEHNAAMGTIPSGNAILVRYSVLGDILTTHSAAAFRPRNVAYFLMRFW
ncbi:hypothetical protein ON010_g16739 [Phytophthora cinnamomi]|nr:hypothetical protein ON010_g16739 [Phytophthora cinnamomi]